MPSSASPSRGPKATFRRGAAWSAPRRRRRRRRGSRASAPRSRHAPRPAASASSSRRPGLPPSQPLTSAQGQRGGHGFAGVGAARGRRPSALPLLTGSGLRRDAGGTNGLHYPRGPAIVRRHQAATAVCGPAGFPRSPRPPSASFRPPRGRLRAAPPPRRAPARASTAQARPGHRPWGGSPSRRTARLAAGWASRAARSRDTRVPVRAWQCAPRAVPDPRRWVLRRRDSELTCCHAAGEVPAKVNPLREMSLNSKS